MALDRQTLARARELQPTAIEEIVNESFPSIARLSYSLSGSNEVGDSVVSAVVRKGLLVLHKWRDEGEPQRWFLRHTILQCRQLARNGSGDDLLIDLSAERPRAYIAFIRALRQLPQQQTEAFLLHFGEAFNLRYTAIAMDCSVSAAEQHLAAATATMQSMAGDAYDQMIALLRQAYHLLTPTSRVRVPRVKTAIRRHVWPRRIWRAGKLLIITGLVAALIWFGYKIIPAIEY
ncbi:MAG TPA: sigma factor-like helix-turn-helix DNA-binding protein [Tepidisphaeraceae bacterium]|nr:sigma factor-like helix-turn-helix DNA-binding protein [Tepidisphaeraceae bacterium]